MGKEGQGWRQLLSEELASLLFLYSAVAYMVSPVAVTYFEEVDVAVVMVVPVVVLDLVLLELVLVAEDKDMYRGWD
ncbi:hypothetical protein L1049_017647 [Liquidambar formosana]|uniref:Uncharacterized protein n=1 Tax=Liquidambar formosana TaxID=63359 RepID=A0AAP0S150_LIQFO